MLFEKTVRLVVEVLQRRDLYGASVVVRLQRFLAFFQSIIPGLRMYLIAITRSARSRDRQSHSSYYVATFLPSGGNVEWIGTLILVLATD